MVLFNFIIAGTLGSRERPKQLTTIPVAGCWKDRETIQCFRNIEWSKAADKSKLPNCFVTDNDEVLLEAIKQAFPESRYILCWVHIQRNFLLRLKRRLCKEVRLNGNGSQNSNFIL
jgi:hypothetical protein